VREVTPKTKQPKKTGPAGLDSPSEIVKRNRINKRRGSVTDVESFLEKQRRKKTFYR
jgi:hypothetical protein